MKSYYRFRKQPKRKYAPSRYRLIPPKIGYLYRAEGRILSAVYPVADPTCRDGELLRVPPQSFTDIYYAKMLPQIRNDAEQEAAAVYFDPYTGQFLVVGSMQLYRDANDIIRCASTPLHIENETPFSFDPMTYGTYFDPDTADHLTFDDYFSPDCTGETIADCMTDPMWDTKPAELRPTATEFFIRYSDRLLSETQKETSDTLTTLLCAIIANGHHWLLSQLFVLIPQLLARFRPTLQQEDKFSGILIPGVPENEAPRLFNLFQYALLCGNADILETIYAFYERPRELTEFVHHPMYYHVGFHHIRRRDCNALSLLLTKNFNPDAIDTGDSRLPLIAAACRASSPGMVSRLLAAKSDPERRDNRGNTAFDYAVAANDCASLALLLSSLDESRAAEWAMSLAEKLPLGDENQGLLGVIRKFL